MPNQTRTTETQEVSKVRIPVFAGSFYPVDPAELQSAVEQCLSESPLPLEEGVLRALVAPHAGYWCSGYVAGRVFQRLQTERDRFRRVLILGPSHRIAFPGIALPRATHFATPLGNLEVDRPLRNLVEDLGVTELEAAHTSEHSLEVQLPFLQVALDQPTILPLVVGNSCRTLTGNLIRSCFKKFPDTLVLVSTDLSHDLPYHQAQTLDQMTAIQIGRLESDLSSYQACGCSALNGLLEAAKFLGWKITTQDLRNSGDTLGSPDRVVGYGGFAAWSET